VVLAAIDDRREFTRRFCCTGRDERFNVPDLGKQFDIEFVQRPSELASLVSAFEHLCRHTVLGSVRAPGVGKTWKAPEALRRRFPRLLFASGSDLVDQDHSASMLRTNGFPSRSRFFLSTMPMKRPRPE
jgi:hypothetical protein